MNIVVLRDVSYCCRVANDAERVGLKQQTERLQLLCYHSIHYFFIILLFYYYCHYYLLFRVIRSSGAVARRPGAESATNFQPEEENLAHLERRRGGCLSVTIRPFHLQTGCPLYSSGQSPGPQQFPSVRNEPSWPPWPLGRFGHRVRAHYARTVHVRSWWPARPLGNGHYTAVWNGHQVAWTNPRRKKEQVIPSCQSIIINYRLPMNFFHSSNRTTFMQRQLVGPYTLLPLWLRTENTLPENCL